MKRIILAIIIIISCLLIKVKAQVSIGPKAGMNLAMITDSTSKGFKGVLTTGVNFGAVINIGLNKKFSIQPEIMFSSKGEEQETQPELGNFYQKFTTNYLEIPILVKYTFGNRALKGFVEAGPYFGYWISGTSIWTDPQGKHTLDYTFEDYSIPSTNITLKDNRLDIGINAGGGVLYAMGPGNIMLDARFGYGLTSINKFTGDELPGWINKKNRVLSISAGYLFNL